MSYDNESIITGTITNADLRPIEGVSVKLYAADDADRADPLQQLVTDSYGKYAIDSAKLHGEYIVIASKEGYLPKELNIQVGGDRITYPDLWLEAADKRPLIMSVDPGDRKPLLMKFGYNEYAIEASPYYRFNDPAYVSVMEHSGANIMRFPGGTVANFYNWANDDFMTEETEKLNPAELVPRDKFATEDQYWAMVSKFSEYLNVQKAKGVKCKQNRGTYGYGDFADLSRRIGADIFYVGNVSMAPGGAEPVDHLTAWMRKLKSDGVSVNYLELGNEIVTPHAVTNTQAIPNGLYDLDKYMEVAERAARNIKAIFPEIKIGILADGLGNKIGGVPGEIDLLDRKVMNKYNTDFFDAVVIHTYLRTTDRNEEGLQIRKDKLLAISKQIVENSINHWKTVFPGKEIWMTETGYIASTPEDEKNLTTSVFTAMLEADYFLRWAEHDQMVTSYVKYFTIATAEHYYPTGHNTIDGHIVKSTMFWNNEAREIIKTPVFHAYSLVAGAAKDSSDRLGIRLTNNDGYLVKTRSWVQDTDEEGLKNPGQGETKELNVKVEYVTAKAFLAKDQSKIYIPFVNKSQAPRELQVELKGVPASGLAISMQSVSGRLMDRNTYREPDRIVPATADVKGGEPLSLPAYSTGVLIIDLSQRQQ